MKNKIAGATVTVMLLAGMSIPLARAGQQADAKDPADPTQQAFQLRMSGHIDEAKKALEEELSANPDNSTAWFELARTEFYRAGQTQEMDTAQVAIEKALEKNPENVRYLCFAGFVAVYNTILKGHAQKTDEMAPQMEKAILALERALEVDPDCDEARLLLVSCYGNNPPDLGGDRSKAEQDVEYLEKHSPVFGAEARCEFSEENQEGMVDLWKGFAEKLESDPRVHENLAKQYARAGDAEKAIASVDRTLELDPTRGQVLLDVALFLAFDKKLEPAEKIIERYLALEPAPPLSLQAYAQFILGQVQKMQGKEKEATANLKKARDLDPYCWFTMRPPPEFLFETL
ncbi:MAG: tetratricopeptide repeat protein [Planctomycetota bacterium]